MKPAFDLGDAARLLRPADLLDTADILTRLFRLSIAGIEVTQAIQYHDATRHLTDPADRQPDNAVPLVAHKPAWVRVYLRSGFLAGDIPGVTGTLEVQRRVLGLFYVPVTTLNPQAPGSVTAHQNPGYAAERGTLSSTLNFVIPADRMCGHLRLIARVHSPAGKSAEFHADLDVTLEQTLRLRGIMVAYNGPSSTAPGSPNLNIAAPTVANLQPTSAWTLLTFPVRSAATYSSGGTITLTVPLSDPPSCAGCCTPNWVTLNAQVAAQVTADGNKTDVLYYGLLPGGVPIGPIIGCESSGVSAGGVGDGITMAHELGHHCGFPHAPCGGVGTPDPTYPAYEPYDPANTPQASIGEYGLDISTGNVFSPATFKDMMSYCGPKWISLHNHGKLINNAKLDPRRVCVDHPWWRDIVLQDPALFPEKWLPDPPPDPWEYRRDVDPVPLISIIGVLRSERELEVTSVMRLETRPQPIGGRTTGLFAELLDDEGNRVARAAVHELRSQACASGCGCGGKGDPDQARYPAVVQALLPDTDGAALRIRRGKRELWSRSGGERKLSVREFKASVEGETVRLRWGTEGADDAPEIWVQWSSDEGRTWSALATGMRGDSAEVAASLLPPGKIALRLLAGDGFHTAGSEWVMVHVPERAPDASILAPRAGQTLVANAPMRLWGAATQAGLVSDAPVEARWMLDGESAAEGLDTFITAPPGGEHKLELLVHVGGREAAAATMFLTIDIERPEDASE